MADKSTIIYTKTDEAPALATYSFLPIVQAFASSSNIEMISKDISLAARILALFPDRLNAAKKRRFLINSLGKLVKKILSKYY